MKYDFFMQKTSKEYLDDKTNKDIAFRPKQNYSRHSLRKYCPLHPLGLTAKLNKGQSNLAKGDIDRRLDNVMWKRNLVDIFYHIHQVAASVVKLVLLMHFGLHFGGRKGRMGSAMVPFERAMVVSYSSPLWPCDISNHSTAIYDQMCPSLNSTGV